MEIKNLIALAFFLLFVFVAIMMLFRSLKLHDQRITEINRAQLGN
jgi:hypothetical protein